MRYLIKILTTLTLAGAFFLSGCDSSSNRMDTAETSEMNADHNSEMITSEVQEEVRVYRLENSDRFKEFNRTKSEIEQQIENEPDAEVRDSLQAELDRHEETQNELKREMDNYQASGRDNWDEFKDSFSDRMDDLGNSLNDFFSNRNTNTSSTN